MQTLSPNVRVGVLRGGPSPEYDVSLKTGAQVLGYLGQLCRPVDILISKNGQWHMDGVERTPSRILNQVDVVWNALHGTYGEDGGVQEVLDRHGAKYTGSDRLASALSMNKWITKQRAQEAGIKTPVFAYVRRTDPIQEKASEIFHSIPHPLIVKPATGGSSIGLYFVQSYPEIMVALETILSMYESAIVEEYIAGREATCGVIDDFRGQETYALPVVEIVPPPAKKLFDYHAKYSGESREVCPGNFTAETKKEIEEMSARIHDALGLSHYSRSDFIVSPRRGVYFLEVNTLPGLTNESLLPKSLEAVGVTMPQFITHVLSLALEEK
jgi:D-alanine-D-alanine ligase